MSLQGFQLLFNSPWCRSLVVVVTRALYCMRVMQGEHCVCFSGAGRGAGRSGC